MEILIQVKNVDSLNEGNDGGKAVGMRNFYIGRSKVSRTR